MKTTLRLADSQLKKMRDEDRTPHPPHAPVPNQVNVSSATRLVVIDASRPGYVPVRVMGRSGKLKTQKIFISSRGGVSFS